MMHNTELNTSNIGGVWMRLDLTEWGQFAATNRIYRQRFFQAQAIFLSRDRLEIIESNGFASILESCLSDAS